MKSRIVSIMIMICMIPNCIGCKNVPQSSYRFVSEGVLSDGTFDFRLLSVEENETWILTDCKSITKGNFEQLENGKIIQPISHDGEVLLLYPKVEIPMKWETFLRTDVILPTISRVVPSYMIPTWLGINEEDLGCEIEDVEFMENIISLAENVGERTTLDFSAVAYRELAMLCYYESVPVLRSRITFYKDDACDAIYVVFPAERADHSGILIINTNLIQELNAYFDQMKQADVK